MIHWRNELKMIKFAAQIFTKFSAEINGFTVHVE